MKNSDWLAVTGLVLIPLLAFGQTGVSGTAKFSCPVKHMVAQQLSERMVHDVYEALSNAFNAALGPNAKHVDQPKVLAKLAATRVDEGRMMELAELSGCAALIDESSSCSLYYDPELGNPLSVFTGMKKTAPLRKQFESAIARVADPEARRAAQACIKLVGMP